MVLLKDKKNWFKESLHEAERGNIFNIEKIKEGGY